MKRSILIIFSISLIYYTQSFAQTISIDAKTSLPGQTVSFPVVASVFPTNDVGAIALYIHVNPGKIAYISNVPGTLPSYAFSYNSTTGLISIGWSFTPPGPPPPPNINGTMLTLNFTYYGGIDTLKFTQNCEMTSIGPPPLTIATTFINGTISPAPTTTYYVDGAVSSSGNGLSWGTALKRISEATNKPITSGDDVLIKPGTYNDTVIVKSNGTEITPLTFNVSVSDTNKITFPSAANLNSVDVADYPGKFYAYLGRSWKGNNGVYKIIQVNKTSKYVIVEGAEFVSETGAVSDSSQLQAAIGFPVVYEKYSTNPQTERIVLNSSGISGERAALHIGKPTSAGDFNVNAANYNIIDGIDVTGADQIGVRIQNSKFNVYKNSRVYELDSIGIMISGNTAKPANCNFVLNNLIYNTKQKAIKVGIQSEASPSNRANLNHFKGNEIYSSGAGANINYTNAVDICQYTGYTVLENNTVRNFKLKNANRGAIELKNNVRRVLAYSNYIKNIDSLNTSGPRSIFYLQTNGNNSKLFNNVIVDSAAVANNIFAFWVKVSTGSYTGGLIAYNTVHKVDNGFKLESGTSAVDVTIKDNIMNLDPTTPEQYRTTGTGLYTVAYNCYSTTPTVYLTETGRLVAADPVFLLPNSYQSAYGFSLQATSPCLNTGNPISGILTDLRRKVRSASAPSRGAFENVISSAYWTGEMNTNWHDYRNWDIKLVPFTTFDVFIPDRANDPIISVSNVTVKTFHLNSAAQIQIIPPRTLTVTN
jgi:hypothetical protein